jgi:hypothetical protein
MTKVVRGCSPLPARDDVSVPKRNILAAAILTLTTACSSSEPEARPSPPARTTGTLTQPYPYTTPTPPAEPTAVDGTYERSVTATEAGPRGRCRRCPPYRLEEGTSTLSLQEGVFRITNEVLEAGAIDWRSVGHFAVSGDEIVLFNDPNCPQTRGTYRWTLTESLLTLEVVDDDCAFGGLRWRYLGAVPWSMVTN